MDNYKLLNEYIVEKQNIEINKDKDGVVIKIEEIVIKDFLKLVRFITKDFLNGADLYFDFDDFYYELIETIKEEYNSEIDDITVDKKFIDIIYRELKLTT